MVISDENNPTLIRPANTKGGSKMGRRKFGAEIQHNQRRALTLINQNSIGAHPYPCVMNKRVLTAKFPAQIASTQPPCPKEPKNPNSSSVQILTVWQDCALTNVEEQKKTATDQPVPMSLEQTEAIMDEKDQREVEMEDIFEDPIVDIDSRDIKNPLAVVDYVDDLYSHYRKMESCSCVASNYMSKQFDINENMRAILIDWLIEVHHKFDLREETLFLTVNLVDRFLAEQAVVRKNLQLVGLVAMLLACKYEEVSFPVVDDLVFISDKAYTRTQILEMESLMLNTVKFNMSIPTPYPFLKRYLKAAQSDRKLELLSFFLIELCLVEYEMLKFPPSLWAAAAVYTAQCTQHGFKQWCKTCEWHSSYSEDQLLECSKLMVGFHQKAATGRLTGVHRKYCTQKFGFAAKCGPAHFLVMTQQ